MNQSIYRARSRHRRLGFTRICLLAGLALGTSTGSLAQDIEGPVPGVAIVGGERVDVIHTAADLTDIKPRTFPKLYKICAGHAKHTYEKLASDETIASDKLMKLHLKATTSNSNCERLAELMLKESAKEKLLSSNQSINDELIKAVYSGDAAARERTLSMMETAGWPTGVIQMHPEDLGLEQLPELD